MDELIKALEEACLIKPSAYHFVCGGGSTVKLVDTFSDKPFYQCRYQGDTNWMTPACEKCTGLTQQERSLNESAETSNYGAKKVIDKLKEIQKTHVLVPKGEYEELKEAAKVGSKYR